MTNWIMDEIKKTCAMYKSRVGGSESCRNSAKYMAGQLEQWADEVHTEEFEFAPQAFMASIPLQAFCDILGAVCMWLYIFAGIRVFAFAGGLCFLIALLSWIYEYVLYRPAFDFLYPKAKGINVHAVRKAEKDTFKRIILVGHSDAAYEMPLLIKFGQKRMAACIIAADSGMVLSIIMCLLMLYISLPSGVLTAFAIIEALLVPAYIPFLFFVNWKVVTDGANDNLSACYIAMAILKEMAEKGERFKHTDIEVLITDGEESGLRGASAFAEKHAEEIFGTDTVVIAMDTMHDPKEMQIYHRGVNFTRKNSEDVCKLLKRAGVECGIDIPYTTFYPGATDAEAFSALGIRAAALCEVSHDPAPYYHTREDNAENLNPEGIALGYNVIKKAVELAAK